MAKTTQNDASVLKFITSSKRLEFSKIFLDIMSKATGETPKMWSESIVGFGECTYTYASGKSGYQPIVGFSPRAGKMSIYLMTGAENHNSLLNELGKHSIGKSCRYVNKLFDIQPDVLKEIISESVTLMREKYKT